MATAQHAKRRWFGMRLTQAEKDTIERLARKKNATQKDAVMDAVRKAAGPEPTRKKPRPGSMAEALQDVCGVIDGPPDLSSNKRYLDDLGASIPG